MANKSEFGKKPSIVKPVEAVAPQITAEVSDFPDTEGTAPPMMPGQTPEPVEKEYDLEKLLPILDAILQDGYATHEFSIRGKKVVLKTRATWEEQIIYKRMEKSGITSAIGYQTLFSIHLLASSLIQFDSYVFQPKAGGTDEEMEASLDERVEFIRSLSSLIKDLMEKQMYEFDDMQRYISKNFEKLSQSF